jgi:hypothetical protein
MAIICCPLGSAQQLLQLWTVKLCPILSTSLQKQLPQVLISSLLGGSSKSAAASSSPWQSVEQKIAYMCLN